MADTARAMARRTPAVALAAAEARDLENATLMRLIDDPPAPTTAFDLFAPAPAMDLSLPSTPPDARCCPRHKYTPPENSGMAFCPYCEIEAMDKDAP